MNNYTIVSRFELDAVQISFEKIEPLETNNLDIKLYTSKVVKDGKEILVGFNNFYYCISFTLLFI